jgi:activator of HSP90 ATPase
MKIINQKYTISASQDKVWDALTNPNQIKKWSGADAEMDENIGTNFKLWGGDIFGKNIEVEKNKKLVQEWYAGNWSKPSIVTFILKELSGKTEVELLHKDIPDKEARDIEQGWKNYYMNPLRELIEEG